MNKKFFTLFALLFFSRVTIDSKGSITMDTEKQYVILSIKNGVSFKYKNKEFFRGDTITFNEKFKLNNNQVVVFKNTKDQTKRIVKGETYTKRKCKNLFDYLFPLKRRIIRDNEPEEHLRAFIGNEFLWTDSLCVNTIYNPNDQRYFVLEIIGDSTNVARFLPSDISRNISFVLTKESIWGEEEPKEIHFNLRVGYGPWYNYKKESEIIVRHVKLIPIEL